MCVLGVAQQKNQYRLLAWQVIGCTVLPGYINDVGTYLLRDCVNTTLNYNPEFIAQVYNCCVSSVALDQLSTVSDP